LDAPAAAIVSSLPLLTRPDRTRLDLLSQAFVLLRPGAAFVQFTYGLTSPMPRRPCALAFDAEVSKPVWLNLPPARVWVYRAASVSSAGPGAAPQAVPERSIRLKLKSGTELLGEELRECGDRIRHEWRAKAEKARADLRAGAEKFKSRLQHRAAGKAVRAQVRDGLDPLGRRRKGTRDDNRLI
jgi:phosphatidylethanolamine/phosphatidyl-N-methylethanolamine N-methyltransferase